MIVTLFKNFSRDYRNNRDFNKMCVYIDCEIHRLEAYTLVVNIKGKKPMGDPRTRKTVDPSK